MTTLEKIKAEIQNLVKTYPFINHIDTYVKEDEVLQILDKYAEQEPCDDVVSRKAVKQEINCWIGSGEYRYAMAERFLIDRINDLQSVNPQATGK